MMTAQNCFTPPIDATALSEARRIHADVSASRRERASLLSEHFEEVRAAGFWPGFMTLLEDFCSDCLLEGAGWFTLHEDARAALGAFGAVGVVLAFAARMQHLGNEHPLARKTRYSEDEMRQTFGSARNWESALLCAILSNDRGLASAISELVADQRLTWDGFEDHHDVFVRHLATCARGAAASVSMNDYDSAKGGANLWINPYRAPLVAFARGERRAIGAAIPEFEDAYHARGRVKDPTHLAFGASKLGQAIGFDIIGTALLRVAVWGGEPVWKGSRIHPWLHG